MAESARRGRDAAHPAVEVLEGRTVMSVGVSLVTAAGVPINSWANYYVTPQSGELDLIVTRGSAHARSSLTIQVSTLGSYEQAQPPNVHMPAATGNVLSVSSGSDRTVQRIVRTTGHNRSNLPIVPISGNYRFAPGQTSLTIPIRLNPKFIPPNGNTNVSVSAYDPTDHSWGYYLATADFNIVPSVDQIPPKLIGSSRTPGAIILTFSKPMNPATTEDVTNYAVYGPNGNGSNPEPLKSAVYNPATRTVTLTPIAPLTQSSYWVKYANDGKAPTDLEGIAANFYTSV